VSDKNRRPIAKREAGESGYGVLAGGRPGELPPDGRRQRPPGVGEREKAFTEQGRPIRPQLDADRTDLDDPLTLGLVPGRLEVDRYVLASQQFADLAAERAVGRRAARAQREGYCPGSTAAVAPAVQANGG